jgi:DNA-binding MarR family transcriptional regulator
LPKVPRSRIPATTAKLNKLRQNYIHLGLDPVETKLVHHILFRGQKARWALYKGRNFANETAHLVGVHPGTLKEKMTKLVERGWLRKGINDEGQAYIQLTAEFGEACLRADERWEVRFVILHDEWQKHNGDDETADLVHALASKMMPLKKYKDAVKAAWHEVTIRRPRVRNRGHHPVTPEVTTRRPERSPSGDLKLIIGERK